MVRVELHKNAAQFTLPTQANPLIAEIHLKWADISPQFHFYKCWCESAPNTDAQTVTFCTCICDFIGLQSYKGKKNML